MKEKITKAEIAALRAQAWGDYHDGIRPRPVVERTEAERLE